MPWFSTLLVITSLSSAGLPFLNGFVGEFLILIGSWISPAIHPLPIIIQRLGIAIGPFNPMRVLTMLAATGVIWAAVYMLWMLQRVVFGTITNPKNAELKDLNAREFALLTPLLVLMFFMGVYPQPFLNRSKASVEAVRNRVVGQAGGAVATTGVDWQNGEHNDVK
jgi:NADH-quinone oxidoreductase subunit M